MMQTIFTTIVIVFCALLTLTYGHVSKCDQKPPLATVDTPRENRGVFVLEIANGEQRDGKIYYTPDQTYVLTVKSTVPTRMFNWFMITAEDPAVDYNKYDLGQQMTDVGTLKTLGLNGKSQYSERCTSSVENIDNSYKTDVEIHWISPKKVKGKSTKNYDVRIRAMVAENREAWYTGDDLTITLYMDDKPSKDSPPLAVKATCNLCSEARYEVVFEGKWSRLTHPRHYPSKPDDNGYSHMVGASHGNNYTLWQQGSRASEGLKRLAETADSSAIERDIINAMSQKNGARTLIRGKRRHHPYMFEGSHSLFRVDRNYHMFSVVVALRPSPDWFLGTSNFELCDANDWLDHYQLPLYPWDAGTMNGVSYESPTRMTQPTGNVERVEVGSFNKDSPFYQINLNDLKPFAFLNIRRLDVYPWNDKSCVEEEEAQAEEQQDEPNISDPKRNCGAPEWGEWTICLPENGICGLGKQSRSRKTKSGGYYGDYGVQYRHNKENASDRCDSEDTRLIQYQDCYVEC